MSYFDEDAREMLDVYLLETGQLIEKLDEILLDSEKNSSLSAENINSIFRIMHTIKSSSAMMGLSDLSTAAHRLEDLFSALRDNKGVPGQIKGMKKDLFQLLFEVSDFIREEMQRMKEENYEPSDITKIKDRIEEYLTSDDKANESQQPQEGFLKQEGIILRVIFEPECRMENIRALMLMRRIKAICSQAECFPSGLENNPLASECIRQQGLLVRVPEGKEKEAFETLTGGVFVKKCEVAAKNSASKAAAKEVLPESEHIPVTPAVPEPEFMDIRLERLDELQNLTGELLVLLSSFSNELKKRKLFELEESYGYQAKQFVEELGKTVLHMRMVPIAQIIPKLRRVLRNICKDQKKEVEFIISGQETEADKNIVDQLCEASMHIIRNAVDHGIESHSERFRMGKPEKGYIRFTVESHGEELMVRISDDGRGIDIMQLREKAREKQLFTKPEEDYTEEEIFEFCTMPGFTTNRTANAYSGRGVGMDIVKKMTDDAGGHLKIESEIGKGTSVVIYLPLTHAIIENILFSAGGQLFSIPFRQTIRFFEHQDADKDIRKENGKSVFLYDNKVLPVIDVAEVYHLEGKSTGKIMLYVKGPIREVCLLVDEVIGQEKLMQKPIPKLLGRDFSTRTGMSGCSILGDGSVCMALDVEKFIRFAQKKSMAGKGKRNGEG